MLVGSASVLKERGKGLSNSVILSGAKYLMLCTLGLTPHPTPLPQGAREKNIFLLTSILSPRRGRQILISRTVRSFTKLNFAFSPPPHPSPLLKERGNAVFS